MKKWRKQNVKFLLRPNHHLFTIFLVFSSNKSYINAIFNQYKIIRVTFCIKKSKFI